MVLLLAACAGGDSGTDPLTAASVTVKVVGDTLTVGDSTQLVAEVRDASGSLLTDRAVQWLSGDTSVLSVSANGVARSVAPGRATITATADGRSGSAVLTARARRWRAVAAGEQHTCAVRVDGKAYCWGYNQFGQLGTASSSAGMVAVEGGYRWTSLVAGKTFTCGLMDGGQAACWGGFQGIRGDVTPTPQLAGGDPGFRVLVAGDEHVCGIAGGGRAYCWGGNFRGQLGIGTVADVQHLDRINPTRVAGDLSVAVIAPGSESTCAITTTGEGFCWGDSDPAAVPAPAPMPAPLESLVRGGTPEREHSCGTAGSDTYCWGYNTSGQVGGGFVSGIDQGYTSPPVRVQVPSGGAFQTLVAAGVRFDASGGHTCGISTQNDLYCWGANNNGQLGDGTTTLRAAPVPVAGGLKFRDVSSRGNHTCGITTGGELYCWGRNSVGQLGAGPRGAGAFSATPVLVP